MLRYGLSHTLEVKKSRIFKSDSLSDTRAEIRESEIQYTRSQIQTGSGKTEILPLSDTDREWKDRNYTTLRYRPRAEKVKIIHFIYSK